MLWFKFTGCHSFLVKLDIKCLLLVELHKNISKSDNHLAIKTGLESKEEDVEIEFLITITLVLIGFDKIAEENSH